MQGAPLFDRPCDTGVTRRHGIPTSDDLIVSLSNRRPTLQQHDSHGHDTTSGGVAEGAKAGCQSDHVRSRAAFVKCAQSVSASSSVELQALHRTNGLRRRAFEIDRMLR